MSDPLTKVIIAITTSFIPSICISSIILGMFTVTEQPFYGQITLGVWVISTTLLYIIFYRDEIANERGYLA